MYFIRKKNKNKNGFYANVKRMVEMFTEGCWLLHG